MWVCSVTGIVCASCLGTGLGWVRLPTGLVIWVHLFRLGLSGGVRLTTATLGVAYDRWPVSRKGGAVMRARELFDDERTERYGR